DAPITVLSATNDAAIGARQALTSSAIDFFDGKIDEVTFYGSALSQQELSAIYNAGSQGKCRSELPVLLQNATATFSQTQGGDYSAASMIDGITTDNRGWGIYPNITNQTAVFETRNDVGFSGGTVFTFSLLFNVISTPGTTAHTLGHFRLSGTTDPRDSFADGLQTGGDVTANWSVLDIISATSQSGAVLTPQPDGSLLASGALNPNDLYTVVMATRLTGITGIRLEALTDPSLPFNGPGREPLDGNFHVAEFTVSARPGLAPAITQQPASSTVSAGQSASLNVVASSSLPVTYQWFLNGATIQNATNTSLTVTNAQLGDAGTYTVSISSSEGTIMSAGAVLNVLPSNASNGATLFVSNRTPTNAPIYDMNGFLLAGPRYLAQVFAAGSDGVYRAASPAVPFLSGADAGFFTPVNLILPDVTPGGTARIFLRVWDSSAGSNYDQAVANGGQHGASDFIQTPTGGAGIPTPQLAALTSFSLVAPPKILTQAANATVFAGQNASFQIQTSGSAPLTYQWSFNSNEIAGATSATLNLTNVQVQQAGAYSVVVSNPLGLAASIPTILTVKIPDTNGPVMVITSPLSGVTFDDRVTLSGSITDNVAVASAKWENNGQTGGSITLQNGQFSIPNLTLTRGTNVLRVTAVDTSSNQTSASVTVVLQASRVLSVGQVASSQEGARVSVPIMLASRGDVSGVTFSLNYDRNYLEDPEIVWDDTLQGAFTQNNTNTPGTVRGSFALSGLTLSAGTQHVANIFFHARSVPQTQEISLALVQSGIFSVTGDPLTTGTDVLSGYVEISRRKYVGDNNANDRLDVGDASEIMRLVNGLETPRPWDVAANDLNKNSLLDVGDVIRVLRAVVGLDQQPGSISQQSFPSGQSARPQIESPVPLPQVMEPAPSVILGVDKQRAAAGDKITVKVNLSAFSGALSGASLKVEYPAAALRLDSASSFKTGAIIPANAINASNLSPNNDYANQDGTISLAVSTDADWATNNGTLAEFTFTVQPGATNQYLWPIQINPVELSSGFDLVTVPGAETTLIGRDAIPASLGGTYNPKDGKFQFSLSGEPGVRYRIEVSDDLKTWSELSTTVNTDGQLEISDPAAGQKPSRFYRAVQLD
ncbi:MAG TPA: immunoglobulin domain-containing protein, partial [Verrucomicrobiae bacterium]|nr:immunoglobulin domain-containing protein [Verrucomicrobiae bacterium]